jgi:hypothetical protein
VYSRFGELTEYVLAPAINPVLMGRPSWPALRQGFRHVRQDGIVMLVTDGLSDPFEHDGPANGFGLELLIATDDSLDQPQHSWAMDLLARTAEMVAGQGDLRALVEELGLLSVEYATVDVPEPFRSAKGNTGVLLGVAAPSLPSRFDVPGGDVLLITVKLLTGVELDYVREGGALARRTLATRFEASGSHHVSSTRRVSVV